MGAQSSNNPSPNKSYRTHSQELSLHDPAPDQLTKKAMLIATYNNQQMRAKATGHGALCTLKSIFEGISFLIPSPTLLIGRPIC